MASYKQTQEALRKAADALKKANAAALAANTPAARNKAKAALAAAQKNHTAAHAAHTAAKAAGGTSTGGAWDATKQAFKDYAMPVGGAATATAFGVNHWKNSENDAKAAAAKAAAPKNTAVDPSKVTVNPSTVKKQAETQTPQQQSGSGVAADGRRAETTPASEGGLGANAVSEADRKVNMETDPNSSGYAWGVNRGGRYADATGRHVTPNAIAAEQQAYLNENNMATARQHSMDFEAQLQDRNSPAFQALDRTMGGELTRRMNWREENERAPKEYKKLSDGVTPEQRKILAKFDATGEGPEPKFKIGAQPDAVAATPAQEVKAQAQKGDDTDAYNAAQSGAPEVKAQAAGAQSTLDEMAQMYAGEAPQDDAFAAFLAGFDPDNTILQDPAEGEGEPTSDDASNSEPPDHEVAPQHQDVTDMVIGAAGDMYGYADEAGRVTSNLKQHGLGKVITGRADLAGIKAPAVGGMAKFGQLANKANVAFNVASGLTDTWDEITGTDGSLMAGLFSGGKTFGMETGNKGRRANAWGGTGLASRAAGGAEAFFNGITGGGYDAMRANTWGGDEYVKQRGGKIEKDPLNAGKFAEWASGKLFKQWDDYQNRKSVASTRSQVAANTKANAKRA